MGEQDGTTAGAAAPYGTWASPITSDLIVAGTVGLGGLSVAGERLYWLESRPTEGGRVTLLSRDADGTIAELTPAPFNVRSRVHEYGGGAYLALGDGRLVAVNFADQRVYVIAPGAAPRPITVDGGKLRFADFAADLARDAVYVVREDHRGAGEPANALVRLSLSGSDQAGEVVAEGHDFFAYPALAPDGQHLAWIAWDHPNMPWDGTTLWLAPLDAAGATGAPVQLAGGPSESVLQPEWADADSLYYIADRTGWWNLYRWRDGHAEPVCPAEAEFGFPLWQLGTRGYRVLGPDRLIATVVRDGLPSTQLVVDGTLVPFESSFAEASVPYRLDDGWVLIGATAKRQAALTLLAMDGREVAVVRASAQPLDAGYISVALPIEFPTDDGASAHAFYYAPTSRDFRGPPGDLPPLIVRSHGGPTGAAGSALSLAIQYWTSRGFAVVDVNYRGSTGFGRAYREKLAGAWGVVDVQDCIAAARYLVEADLVDPRRLAIRGGSAGGFTTLAALTFHDVFRAGASLYGIGDLMALARDTHKFEARYLDRLVGPLPEAEARYRERSPVNFTDQLSCPVIFFQGLDDKVVPPNQAEAMVDVLRAKGLPVAYLPFAGEGHGFRRAENIKRALEAELYFYGRIFGFAPADRIEPVEIDNL